MKKGIILSVLCCAGLILMSGCGEKPVSSQENSEPKNSITESSVSQVSNEKTNAASKDEESKTEESKKLTEADEEKIRTIRVLAEKKNELKEQKDFSYAEQKYAMGRCYYCDAVIKDFNDDGTYEMIVKYIATVSLPRSGSEWDYKTYDFMYYNVVYDMYTVHDGKAVSSGHLKDSYPFSARSVI